MLASKGTMTWKLQDVTRYSVLGLVIPIHHSLIKSYIAVTVAHTKQEENILVLVFQECKERQFEEMNLNMRLTKFLLILPKDRKVTLGVHIFYVNITRFFVRNSKCIGFGTTQPIGNGNVSTLANSLDTVVNLYRNKGFQVMFALIDNQF